MAAALVSLIILTVFEFLKTVLHPDMTVIESHMLTVAFGTVASMIVAGFVWRAHRRLHAKVVEGMVQHERDEAARRQLEQRFRLMIERSLDIITILSSRGEVLYDSPAVEKVLGWHPQETVGRDYLEHVHPDDRDRMTAFIRKDVARHGDDASTETRMRHKDGTWRHMLISALNCTDEPAIGGIVCDARDITEQIRDQEAVKASEIKYRVVADNTYEWEFWLGPGVSFLYVSPSCKRISGHDAAEFLADATLLRRIVHPDDADAYQRHLAKARAGSQAEQTDFRIVRPDGVIRWISHVCHPIHDENGQFLGFRGTNRDMTEQKAAQVEREQLIDGLTNALSMVKTLSGLIPICASCKKIRDDRGYWNQVEKFISERSDVQFTHGICPDCLRKFDPDYRPE